MGTVTSIIPRQNPPVNDPEPEEPLTPEERVEGFFLAGTWYLDTPTAAPWWRDEGPVASGRSTLAAVIDWAQWLLEGEVAR